MQYQVREEQVGDADGIRLVNELAFAGPDEARLVEALRGVPGTISLVATAGDDLVGHILFTPVQVEGIDAAHAVVGLGPMAVRPDHQRLGVGSQLVRAGLHACGAAGYAGAVVVGHPAYYPRFGFVAGDTKGLRCEYAVPREAFMVLELVPGTFEGAAGVVKYRPEFGTP
jgi:putative acetyltransferase